MPYQDDRTFRIPDRPPGGGGVILQRVERVLDRNDLEASIFKIWNDFVPGRPVSKRTVDQDDRFGFQFGSPSWQADCAHRTQEDAQANNTFVEFHGYTPWFGGHPLSPLWLFVRGGLLGVGPAECYARRGHTDQSLGRAGAGMSGAMRPVWTCAGGVESIGFSGVKSLGAS